MRKIILRTALAILISATAVFAPRLAAFADGKCDDGQVQTSVLGTQNGDVKCVDVGNEGEGVFMILNVILTVLTFGVGILATIGIVVAGYQYLTAKDDASKVQKAKDRITQIVIGLGIYGVMWAALQFLLPGGLFGDGS